MAVDQEQSIQQIEDEGVVPMYTKRDVALVRGEGYYLWDSEGRRYLDFASNYGVNILGHANPAVTAAISEQAGRLISCHQSFYNDVRARYLERLRTILPSPLSRAFFSNSGAESVEAALKFARAATGRVEVVSARRGYHGRTYGALSATPEKKYREPYLPVLEGFQSVPFGDVEALEAALTPETAAVILEPVQGEGGVHPAPDGYLETVLNLAHRNGSMLILDEVQTGFRTGRYFGLEHSGVVPDFLCLSKGIANGVPMGLTVTSEEIAARLPAGTHGNTFGGNPLAAAAALAVLEEIERENLLRHSAEMGAYMLERLREFDRASVREVRGLGLMVAVDLRERATKYLRALQERGIIALSAGPTTLRFLPPLIVDKEAVDQLVETLGEVLGRGKAT
ncbi:MAG: aminotransferase class III-fold pyridoxal phosphate-dependent enzyme [Chloroflexota bacterium]|nr:aminotransferase class III-fold pyridoxal phosphate-dependent enzyme [Chloroflexota bacterium]